MKNEKLLSFLKDYAKILKDGIDWEDIGYLYLLSGSESAGCVRVARDLTEEEGFGHEVVATFHTRGMPCSMPVSARDYQLAKLLIEANKFLLNEERREKEEQE